MRIFAGSVALAALCAGSVARADVTPDQVWEQWKGLAADAGQKVTVASRDETGNSLTLKGVTLALEKPEMSVTTSIDQVVLKGMGDGSVQVTVTPDMPMTFDSHTKDGKSLKMTLQGRQEGLKVIVSGSPGDMTYDYQAAKLSADLPGMEVDGKKVDTTVSFAMTGVAASYKVTEGEARHVASTFNAKGATLSVLAQKPVEQGAENGGENGTEKGGGTLKLTAEAKDLTGSSATDMVKGTSSKDMTAAVKAGSKLAATMGVGSVTYAFGVDEGGKQTQGKGSVTDGKLQVGLGKPGLHYATSAAAGDLTISGSEIPLPQVSLSIGQSAFDMMLPLLKGEAAQPYSLMVKLGGVRLGDAIWSMVDPDQVLPHDPAEVELNLAGMVTLARDLLETEQATAPLTPPGQLDSLDIKALHLAAAGSDLSGHGAFTFDNSMGPQPVPEGAIDLVLKGGMGLIDKLVKMGLIPDDQAAGAKMMLGLFSKPGEGPDTLTSKIEVKKDGQILANGQRIK